MYKINKILKNNGETKNNTPSMAANPGPAQAPTPTLASVSVPTPYRRFTYT